MTTEAMSILSRDSSKTVYFVQVRRWAGRYFVRYNVPVLASNVQEVYDKFPKVCGEEIEHVRETVDVVFL